MRLPKLIELSLVKPTPASQRQKNATYFLAGIDQDDIEVVRRPGTTTAVFLAGVSLSADTATYFNWQ